MRSFRVSDLEDFRRYRTADEEDAISVEEIVSRLRGERVATQRMDAGTALHKILQHVDAADLPGEEFDRIEMDGFTFVFECDIPLVLLPVREVELSRVFHVNGEHVRLVGHTDALGGYVKDWKLTKSFDAEGYMDSMQWRCYLLLTGLDKFVYEAFEYREPLQCRPCAGRGGWGRLEPHSTAVVCDECGDTGYRREYRIKAHHALTVHRYPGIEDDVTRELALLAEFAKSQGIEGRAQ